MTFDALSTSLVFWEVLTFVVLMAVILTFRSKIRRWFRGGGAKEAVDRRYANGEITREEYLTTRDDIKRNPDA